MKFKNEMIIISLILFILISISAVSAESNNTEIITSNDNVEDNILSLDVNDNNLTENNDDILTDQDSGSFSDLNTKINSGTSTEISLENDYNYTAAYNSGNGVSITKNNVVVDGKGHTIDGNGQSRALYVTATGVTLKNINFVNGYATHAGAVYFNKEITIINCTFINNNAYGVSNTGFGGGALYGSNVGANVQNCTFENNIAGRNGGAICMLEGSSSQSTITNCKFINNSADNCGGAIYLRHHTTTFDNIDRCIFKDNVALNGNDISTAVQANGSYNLTNSIILNPTVNSIYLHDSCTFYVNNNWWGNTKENFNVKPTISSQSSQYQPIMKKWYYLDMNINYKLNTSDIVLNNLYDEENNEVIVDNTCRLADLMFTLSAVNATVPENVTVKNGKKTVEYTRSQPTGLLIATYEDISISKEIFKPRGDFNIIQELIDNDTDNNVELLRDYVYDIYWDTITDGITVTKNNLVIDGKGYKIDAKEMSRIFKIVANNVTLKNIKFINGYSSYAGAVYYSGTNINILNCIFENNVVENTTTSNGLGGAMYINPSEGCTIEDCTFTSNSASIRGGAIFLFTQTGIEYSLNRNIFIKNNAGQFGGAIFTNGPGTIDISNSSFIKNNASQAGGAIFTNGQCTIDISNSIFIKNNADQYGGAIFTNGQCTIDISNSIFLNNNPDHVNSASNYVTLSYNWWGNTIKDYTEWPEVYTYADYDWYFLNMEINETTKTATVSLNNYYDGSVHQVSGFNLPKITLDVSGVNVTVQNKVTLDDSGKATIPYDPTGESGSLTVSVEDVSITKNLNKLLGEFGNLDELISTSTSGLIELDKNYTYSMYLDDDFVDGINITKSNIVIDGKGHTIDAQGQSRIFHILGNQVTFKNIKFINAKSSTYAGAIYGYGDNLYIINCTFINNTAAKYGGAVYWYPDSYSCAINCTFINNTAATYGGAITIREYYTGITSDVINCTFINNKASSQGGAIWDYSEKMNAIANIYGCVFFNNDAPEGSAIYTYIGHVNISNSIFLDNPNKAVETYGYYTTADYNWWGNTYDNRTISPAVHKDVTVNNWLYLDIIPNIADSTVTISINNLFDNETKSTRIYSTNLLPSISVNLTTVNATLEANNVTTDKTGKGTVAYVISDDASITATCGAVTQTKNIDYGSFDKLQNLIRYAEDNSVITLTRDYVWGMGDTIAQGVVLINKHNITIDGNGHIVDGAFKSRVFGVDIQSTDIVFKNIIIQNGKYPGDINRDFGGGMVSESNSLKLINCTFRNNIANGTTGGGALYISGDDTYLINCTFINNTHAYSVGGAVYLHGSGMHIINTLFENNTADSILGGAGAIYLVHGGSTIINSTFKHNVAKYGGAIYDYGHDNINNIIDGCTFINNIASDEDNVVGGGAIHSDKSTITNSVFIGNHARYGAAIYNEFNSSSVDKCIFINNTGNDIIFWYDAGNITNSIFLNNDVGYNFYLISNLYGGLKVENNWFGNTWDNYMSEPHVSNLANMTSWIFLNATDMVYDFDNTTLTMKFNLFSYNSTTGTVSPYNFNMLPLFNLTLTTQNVTFNTSKVGIGEQICGTSEYKGSVTAKYEDVTYTVPFKYQKESRIVVDPILNITAVDKVTLSFSILPWEDDYLVFLKEPYSHGIITFSSSNTSVVTVDKTGKITGVGEGVANVTIFYNGFDSMGRDRCLPSNATVLVNVTRMATHIHFIYEPPTTLYVNENGNIMASIYDANNKSISGAYITYTNNNPTVLNLAGNSYRALTEGVANITMSYEGNSKYLPLSYDLIINITKRPVTITLSSYYLELKITKHYKIGVTVSPNYLVTAISNDTNVAISDDEGYVSAIGVGLANITYRFEGNDNYQASEAYLIVNVTDEKSHIEAPDELTLNLTDSIYLSASVRNENDELIGYDIIFTSNDTSVVTVDEYGMINTTGVGKANITLTFLGRNEYGPSSKNVTVTVKRVQTEILVNETISMFTGERINLNAALNYPEAGKLHYDYEGDNVVVDSKGNIAAISEGIATVTITCTVSSDKFIPPVSKTVTVNVTRRVSEINLTKDLLELNVLDEVNINASTVPEHVGVLKYSSNDTSVAVVDQYGNIIAKGEGTANITINFEGNTNYLPSTAYVIVRVTTIATEITVADSINVNAGENGNIGAVLTPAEAGALIYSSNDTSVVTVDGEGNFHAVGGGVANITVEFVGTERYVGSIAHVIVTVSKNQTEIRVNSSYDLNVLDVVDLNATLTPSEAGVLEYLSNDTSVVTVENGVITAVGVGQAKITVKFSETNVYLPSVAYVIVKVTTIATEITVVDSISVNAGENGNIGAVLTPAEAGTLSYSSNDTSVVTVDGEGNFHAVGGGVANITVEFAGTERYVKSVAYVIVTVSKNQTEIKVNSSYDLNVLDVVDLNATLTPSEAGVLEYLSNDTSVVTVENGVITAVGVGQAKITVKFNETNVFLPSVAYVIVKVTTIATEITVVDSIGVNAGESGNLGAVLTPAEAGVLSYSSNDTSVVTVDGEGNFHAVGGGVANITVEFAGTERYVKSVAYVIVTVSKNQTEIKVNSSYDLIVLDVVDLNATLTPSEAGVLEYLSNDTSVVTVENGIITAVGEGVANITVKYAGSNIYLPATEYVIVRVTTIPTQIDVVDNIDLYVTDSGNLNAVLSPAEAGVLSYSSNDTNVIIIDENGNYQAVGEGVANITVEFAGTARYVKSTEHVIISVARKTSQISVNESITLYVDENKTLSITTIPEGAELTLTINDETIATVDASGKVTGKKVGKTNITINYAGTVEYLPCSVNVTVEVVFIPTEIIADKTYGLKIDTQGQINAVLNHPEAGNLSFASENESIVKIDENGNLETVAVGSANITIGFAGNNKYAPCTAKVLVSVYRSDIATEIIVNDTLELYVGNQTNIGAELIPANAGNLIYTTTSDIIVIDSEGNIRAVKVGSANVTITFPGNDRFNPSNATVKVIVSQIPTEIIVSQNNITLNLTENTTIDARLNHPEAGSLTYTSSNESIVSVDGNGLIIANGVGNANITISYSGNENYTAAQDVIINVKVVTVTTEISVDSTDVSLFVDDEVNVNATLNYPEAGVLVYTSSNSSVVSVDNAGNLVAVGEGQAIINISFAGNGKFLPSNRTVKVTVSKVATEINVLNDTITLNLTDSANIVASLTPAGAGNLTFTSSNSSVVSVDAEGKIVAVGVGSAVVSVDFAGDYKYVASSATVNVVVTTVATEISVDSTDISLFVDDEVNVNATLNYPEAGVLIYTSSNSSVVSVDNNGNLVAVGAGEAIVNITFAGNGKFLPSNRTVKVTVSKITTEINVLNSTITLDLTDSANIVAGLTPAEAGNLTFTSSNSSVVSVDADGKLIAVGAGSAVVSVDFAGDYKYVASSATVSVVVTTVATEINVDSTDISLFVDDEVNVNATLNYPEAGDLTYTSSNSSVVSVDNAGNLIAVGAGEAIVNITFAGNGKFLPSNRTVKVTVSKIATDVNVLNSTITLNLTDSANIVAGLTPAEAGNLTFTSSNSSVVTVGADGKIIAVGAGSAMITVDFAGDYKYVASSATVSVVVTTVATEINVDSTEIALFVDDEVNVNATLNYPEAGNLTYISGNSSVVTIDNAGNLVAVGEGQAIINISFAGNGKFLPSNRTVKVTVSKIATDVNVLNSTITLNLTDSANIVASLTPAEAGNLTFTSSNSSVVSVDADGKITAVGVGSVIITVDFAGDYKYVASSATVSVVVTTVATEINVDSTDISLFVDGKVNVNATLNYPEAGDLTYTSSNSSVVSVDNAGNLVAVGEGQAIINISFAGNGKFLPSNRTVKVTVSKIATEINVLNDTITLNLTDSANIVAGLTPAEAGSLTYTSSNSSVVSVDADGKLIAVGAGSAVVNIDYAGDYKYVASSATVSVVVTTVATEINVDSTEIALYVDGEVNVNATLNYPEAGSLTYTSSNNGVVTVDSTGKLTATGEGEATINITFAGNGKYLPSSKTIRVVVSRIPTQITVDSDYIELFVDEKVNVNATFSHPEVEDLIYDISNGTIASVDEWGNVVAKHEGTAEIYISYLGSNKYLPCEKIVTVKVSRIGTEIDPGNDTFVEIGASSWISAVLSPNKYGKLHFNSSNPDIILIDDSGFYSAVGFGSATITVSFAGDDKYAPSSATVKLTVKGRQTEIHVENNVSLTVEDSLNLGAILVFTNGNVPMGSADLKYTSSDPSIVSVDRDGKITALKSGKVQILVYYEGSVIGENIINYASNATVNVTSIPKASSMSVSTDRVTLDVRQNTTVTARLIVPTEGTITFTSEDESIATVTQDGFIKAVGKGTTRIIVNYAGNKDYLPSTKYITVKVKPLPVEITVNDSFAIVKGNQLALEAILTPDVGQLTYTSSDENVADVLDNGVVWAKNTGISVITVRYGGNSEYDEAYKLVTIQVTLNTTSIDVADNVILSIGDVANVNASLNPANAGNLIYSSSDESVVRIFSDGRMVAMKDGNAVITIKYEGSYQYEPSSAEVNVTVVKNSKSVEIDINPSDVSDDSTFSISLPSDATGTFSVIVDGKTVATKALKNGKASIKVTRLSTGDHSVTVVYSGDKKYAGASKSTTIHIYEIKIKSKNLSKLYTSKNKFTIQLTRDTQALSGKVVKFTLNGKKLKAKTNKNGYASIKVNLPPRAKAYKVTAQFGKIKVKNKIKVKGIVKAKNLKVKKPKKVLKIKVALKKVNGKFLKGKKLKLRLKGKTFKAKTNKKGKAVFKVKKKFFKKLKVGKKYKYKVTYKKNSVKRTLKFKR